MNVTLPEKTAGPCTLPEGTEVWVQTVNSLQMGRARSDADLFAMRETGAWRRGGAGWEMEAALAEEREPAALVEALLQDEREGLRAKAEELNPFPQTPIRDKGEDDERFAGRVIRHDEAAAAVVGQREKAVEKSLQEERGRVAALSLPEQIERWCRLQLERRRRAAFAQRMVTAMLYYGTRKAEDHGHLYFAGIEAVEDLDDATREKLTDAYFGWDTVTAEQVPTSPPA